MLELEGCGGSDGSGVKKIVWMVVIDSFFCPQQPFFCSLFARGSRQNKISKSPSKSYSTRLSTIMFEWSWSGMLALGGKTNIPAEYLRGKRPISA